MAAADPRAFACKHCGSPVFQPCVTSKGKSCPDHRVRRDEAKLVDLATEAWNAENPIGTMVRAYPGLRPDSQWARGGIRITEVVGPTRTQAWIPEGHSRPVVMIHSLSSWIALTHVDVIERKL